MGDTHQRQLPDELLTEIFTLVCCKPISLGVVDGPIWILQRVCQRWWRLARSIPVLWSSFESRSWGSVKRRAVPQHLKTCLKLSGKSPLTTSFSHPVIRPYDMFEDLANHAVRWASFSASWDLLEYIINSTSMMDSIKQQGLFRLRNLEISGLDGLQQSTFLDIFNSATTLEEATLSNIVSASDVSKFPWASLKKLTMINCFFSGENTISIYRAISSLEELTWRHSIIELKSILIIPLPPLHSLTVQDTFNEVTEQFRPQYWRMFRTPSLTNIHIIQDIRYYERISHMIQTSNVKSLKLEKSSTRFLLEIAEHVPGVEELSLTEENQISVALLMLTRDPEANPEAFHLLPSLRKLEIHPNYLATDNFVPSLMECMRSRSNTTTATEQKYSLTAFPLLNVKCNVWDPDGRNYGTSLTAVISLGEELGINVEIQYC
ncbi:hypothetical protein BDQ17DRAFT_1380285 [Cyathus striatus]|nr:hypothetical protein BDQ17DRAFT_1380285 [Cyathus striatus]